MRLKALMKQLETIEKERTTKFDGYRKVGVGLSADLIIRNALDKFALENDLFNYGDYRDDRKK